MAIGMTVIGADAFAKMLAAYPRLVDRTLESVLKQEARSLCVKLGGASMPLGLQETDRVQQHRRKVGIQIGWVYMSLDNHRAVLAAIKRRSPMLASGYARARAENNTIQMRRYMAAAGLVMGPLNPARHRAARGGENGNVNNSGPPDLVPKQQLDAYIRKKQANVGTAKAGWYAAGMALGGRIRRNLVAADGKRSTIEIFPAYVKKLARKFPGLGGARVSPGRVEIYSNVRHARDAFILNHLDDAIYYGSLSFTEAIRKSMALIRQRGFREAA